MRKIRRGELRYYMKSYPTTTVLAILMMFGFICNLIGINHQLAFLGLESLKRPWTILTYSFALLSPPGFAFLSALFAIVTFWFLGRSIESRWGSWGWAFFLILTSLTASAWSLVIGSVGLGLIALYEPWLVLGGAMMLWAWENPGMSILANGLFPIKACYLAWIYVAFNFFLLFPAGILTACTALIPVGVAWIWQKTERKRIAGVAFRKKELRNRRYLKRVK